MKLTLEIDKTLLREARSLTGIRKTATLVHAGLEALIRSASAQRLAELGGTEPRLRPIERRASGKRR